MDRLYIFLATGAYVGYLPKAPGTWGSLLGVLVWWASRPLPPEAYWSIVGGLSVAGVISAGAVEKIVDRGDPGLVVIDEVVGQLIALAYAPLHPGAAVAGFVLFRVFDILKPFPVGWVDQHIHGGVGIMLDDIVAGCYAFVILQIGLWLLKIA